MVAEPPPLTVEDINSVMAYKVRAWNGKRRRAQHDAIRKAPAKRYDMRGREVSRKKE